MRSCSHAGLIAYCLLLAPCPLLPAPARILALRNAAGTRVRCSRGRGWVTVEGDPADYWISAGDEMQVRSPGRVVIEAYPGGELQVTLPTGRCGRQAV